MKTKKPVFKSKSKKPSTHAGATPQHSITANKLLRCCGELADSNSLLDEFASSVRAAGLVGETKNAQIIFLAVISRLLNRPVSVVVKGARSGGKNTVVESVLKFFSPLAYHQLTAMSEKAMAHFHEPLAHRTLVVTEAAGLKQGGDLFLRSLLSEGRISYDVVRGGRTCSVKLEGPTGLILTTTEVKLYEDDESRLISLDIIEDPDHTRDILNSIGDGFADPSRRKKKKVPQSWLSLLEWIAIRPPEVRIPFAPSVTRLLCGSDTRLHRDVNALFGLVCAHALLHRRKRKLDSKGHLLATLDDYKAVRHLVHDVIARGIGSAVSPSVRRVVDAVKRRSNGATGVSGRALAADLGIHRAGISRHIKDAMGIGYVKNLEAGKGKTAQYVVGDLMPADTAVLPLAKAVDRHHRERKAKRKSEAA